MSEKDKSARTPEENEKVEMKNPRREFIRSALALGAATAGGAALLSPRTSGASDAGDAGTAMGGASPEAQCDPPKVQGFLLPFVSEGDSTVAKEFLANPSEFLAERGLNFDDIQCPPEAHDAWNRGVAFVEEATPTYPIDQAGLEHIATVAERHLGPDYDVQYQAYGLKFLERVTDIMGNVGTATATGVITFLDGGSDTDS